MSLRPAPVPRQPVGVTVSGTFVGWNGKAHPEGKISLDVEGQTREYLTDDSVLWYDGGVKVTADTDRAFDRRPVTIRLVKRGAREEVVIIRTEK